MSSLSDKLVKKSSVEDLEMKPKASPLVKQRAVQPVGTSKYRNSALLFIKPELFSPLVKDVIEQRLLEVPSLSIKCQAAVTGRRAQDKQLVDLQYFRVANNACTVTPASALNAIHSHPSPKEIFSSFFKESLNVVVSEKRIMNARAACDLFALTPGILEELWQNAESEQMVCKMGQEFYCARLKVPTGDASAMVYVVNGFYLAFREKFTNPNAMTHCYEVDWNASEMSWRDLREKVIGCADPSQALKGSIRRQIYDSWEDLGLPSQPSLMNNVVHFSASPLEGLREKLNWIQRKFLEDPYGRALAEQGITRALLKESFFFDPMVTVPGRDTGKVNIFEVLKDLDAKECLDMMIRVYDQELNEALREKVCSGCSCIIS